MDINDDLQQQILWTENSKTFLKENQGNFALDVTASAVALENGSDNFSYVFYFRPNFGNEKKWVNTTNFNWNQKYLDLIKNSNASSWKNAILSDASYIDIKLENDKIALDFNNKKDCNFVLESSDFNWQYLNNRQTNEVIFNKSKWKKVVVNQKCIAKDETNVISYQINNNYKNKVTIANKQYTYVEQSYGKIYYNPLVQLKPAMLNNFKEPIVGQYLNVDYESNKLFTYKDVFWVDWIYQNNYQSTSQTNNLNSWFSYRLNFNVAELGFDNEDQQSIYLEIDKFKNILLNLLNIKTSSLIISSNGNYNFEQLPGILVWDFSKMMYHHQFNSYNVYNNLKHQVESDKKLNQQGFLIDPFVKNENLIFKTFLEFSKTKVIDLKTNVIYHNEFNFDNIKINYYQTQGKIDLHSQIIQSKEQYFFTQQDLYQFYNVDFDGKAYDHFVSSYYKVGYYE